jgi:hypothetical protein
LHLDAPELHKKPSGLKLFAAEHYMLGGAYVLAADLFLSLNSNARVFESKMWMEAAKLWAIICILSSIDQRLEPDVVVDTLRIS